MGRLVKAKLSIIENKIVLCSVVHAHIAMCLMCMISQVNYKCSIALSMKIKDFFNLDNFRRPQLKMIKLGKL